MELKTQEERMLSDRLKQSSHGQQLGDIDALQATITEQVTRSELYLATLDQRC